MKDRKEEIDELRGILGTLPNRDNEISGEIVKGCSKLRIDLIDQPTNIYKSIFTGTTQTWCDNENENKWIKCSPESRYRVVVAALKGKTLPTPLEAGVYTFQVSSMPRNNFDQIARSRVGSSFYSSGLRDNSRLDADFILYSKLYDIEPELRKEIDKLLGDVKRVYKKIITSGQGSYQIARSILPMSYSHPYSFSMSLLALIGQSRRRCCMAEEEFVVAVFFKIRQLFKDMGLELLADVLYPACDRVKRCLYAKSDGSELFGCLFKSCGRHPGGIDYAEFNQSCSDKKTLEEQLGFKIPNPEDYVGFGPDDYDKIGEGDKKLLGDY